MKLVKKLLLIGVIVFGLLSYHNYTINNFAQVQQEKQLQETIISNEIDYHKELLKDKNNRALSMINHVSNDIEIVCLTVEGNYSSSYSRKSADDFTFFNNSTIDVKNDFISKIGIEVNNVNMTADNNGNVDITYDTNDIKILSTQIKDTTYSNKKDLFGKEYSKSELIAIIENNEQNFKERVLNNMDNIHNAEVNLQNYYINMAKTYGVKSVSFNGNNVTNLSNCEYVNCTNVKYGHNNTPLNKENVKYIIIHGTGEEVKDVDAMNFITNLNRDDGLEKNNKKNATHFYIDDSKIVQALDLNIESWNAGKQYNPYSISLEISTYSNKSKQEQAIRNAVSLVEILKKEYPQAKIVTHKQISSYGKKCPSFIYGDDAIMNEDTFLEMFEN